MLTARIKVNAKLKSSHGRAGFFFQVLLLILIACLYAGLNSWIEWNNRIYPLDIDGWGYLVDRLETHGNNLTLLFHDPSLWKGPIIPFLFGLSYYIYPFKESVILFNVASFSISSFCLLIAFSYMRIRFIYTIITIFLWIFYLHTHKYVFGYYYAEPILTLISLILFLLVGRTVIKTSPFTALASGGMAGLLLLSRAPFIFVVAGIPIVLWMHLVDKRILSIILFSLGLLLVYMPWPVRNFMVYGAFIPFTTEGGKVLFQGSYLKGDSDILNNIRQIPEFVELEAREKGKSAVEKDRYWQHLAIEQIRKAPLKQLRLCLRKTLRFWVYLPAHSWIPSWKTAVAAMLFLPLAFFGLVCQRHHLLAQMCALWAGGLWLFHSIVHTELRYNFPVLPMVFMLAVVGIHCLIPCLIQRESKEIT